MKFTPVYFVYLTLLLLALPESAYAYIDPGTGSMIFQVVIAAVLGALFTIKQFWHRIVAFFRPKRSEEEKENAPTEIE